MEIKRISPGDSLRIGENLKAVMERTGVNMEDLAVDMEILPEELTDLLSGNEIFTLWLLMKAAKVMDVSTDELINGCEMQSNSSRNIARLYGILPELSAENMDMVMNHAIFLASGRWNGFRNEILKEGDGGYGGNAYYNNLRRINDGGILMDIQERRRGRRISNDDDGR